jgi:hypothetical protein
MSDKACMIRGKVPVADSEKPGSSVRKPFQFQPTKIIKIAKKLSEGNKVLHAKFGVGLIKQKLGRQVFRVAFEDHSTVNIRCDYLSLI